jgi:hypothetical protein
MEPEYEIEGTEGEAGVRATMPIESPAGREVVRHAYAQGSRHARTAGLRGATTAPDPKPMHAAELVDKSGMTGRPCILYGWLLLLIKAIPSAIPASTALGSGFEWPMLVSALVESMVMGAIIATAISNFRRYWN